MRNSVIIGTAIVGLGLATLIDVAITRPTLRITRQTSHLTEQLREDQLPMTNDNYKSHTEGYLNKIPSSASSYLER